MGARRTPCGWRLLFFLALLLAEVRHGSSSSSSGVKAGAAADALPPRLSSAEGMCVCSAPANALLYLCHRVIPLSSAFGSMVRKHI